MVEVPSVERRVETLVLCYGGAGVPLLFNDIQYEVLAIHTYLHSIDVSKVHSKSIMAAHRHRWR